MPTTETGVPTAGRGAVLTLRFLTELALLAALVAAGVLLPAPLPVRVAVAVLVPVAVAVVWGTFLSPRARRPLDDPPALVVEIVLFLLGTVALVLVGHPVWAVVLAVCGIGCAVLIRALRLHHRSGAVPAA